MGFLKFNTEYRFKHFKASFASGSSSLNVFTVPEDQYFFMLKRRVRTTSGNVTLNFTNAASIAFSGICVDQDPDHRQWYAPGTDVVASFEGEAPAGATVTVDIFGFEVDRQIIDKFIAGLIRWIWLLHWWQWWKSSSSSSSSDSSGSSGSSGTPSSSSSGSSSAPLPEVLYVRNRKNNGGEWQTATKSNEFFTNGKPEYHGQWDLKYVYCVENGTYYWCAGFAGPMNAIDDTITLEQMNSELEEYSCLASDNPCGVYPEKLYIQLEVSDVAYSLD